MNPAAKAIDDLLDRLVAIQDDSLQPALYAIEDLWDSIEDDARALANDRSASREAVEDANSRVGDCEDAHRLVVEARDKIDTAISYLERALKLIERATE